MIDEFTILIILGAIFVTILVVIIIRVISLIPNKIKKDNEIDNNALMKITNEFISFSLGLTQEIIDNLPDHIFNMVGEGLGN